MKILVLLFSLLINWASFAVESQFHGVVDFRATVTDSLDSYLQGGYGKFSSDDGSHLSIAQAGGELVVAWENGMSAHAVANAYLNNGNDAIGFTEGYVKYVSIPNSSGYRWQTKLGMFYPKISLENNAYAWASKNTLNSSTINTWIGEEIRILGTEVSLTRLGRLNQDNFDLTISATAFVNNDPAGALLSWHGWTISNRQTLWTEKGTIPDFPARQPGYSLQHQAAESDPFLEVDNQIGFHGRVEWKLQGKGLIDFGYYDNNAKPYIVDNGDYAWRTRFIHLGMKWWLPENIELSAQILTGDTLMQSPFRREVVNNDFSSGYIALSKHILQHRVTLRLEQFSVTDHDKTTGDNNNEQGNAVTANYSYRLSKPWFLSVEYIWIDSYRPARAYVNEPIDFVEQQLQLAARYFF